MKPTATLVVFVLFLLVAIGGQFWISFGNGAEDGGVLVRNSFAALAAIVAIGSRLFGGKFFTDSANGH